MYYGKKQRQKRSSFVGFLIALIIIAGLVKLIAPEFWQMTGEKWNNFKETGGFTDFKSALTDFKDVKSFVSELKEGIFGRKKEPVPVSAQEEEEPSAEPTLRTYTVSEYRGLSAPAAADPSQARQMQVSRAFSVSQQPFSDRAMPTNATAHCESLSFPHAAPVEGAVTSGFGYRYHPVTGKVSFHYGADLAADEGECVTAFAAGQVSAVGSNSIYGTYVLLSHPGGYQTCYAHLSGVSVRKGDIVDPGDNIGMVGSTGLATGPHLHFEVRLDGKYLNPLYYIENADDASA